MTTPLVFICSYSLLLGVMRQKGVTLRGGIPYFTFILLFIYFLLFSSALPSKKKSFFYFLFFNCLMANVNLGEKKVYLTRISLNFLSSSL